MSLPAFKLLLLRRSLGLVVTAAALAGCRFDLDPDLEHGAYRLGGTVVGLDADGLELANGDDRIAIERDATRFTLPRLVPEGDTYSIRVEQQPVGRTCSVAAGWGRMVAHDMPNAVVTCARNAYALGGRIDGLATAGLVLANGADILAIAPGDTGFRMPAPVASGGSFSVTVAAQPAGQACHVDGGQGQVIDADIDAIVVSCTDEHFSVGGTVTGLVSSGLVLADGSRTLSVAAGDTRFAWPATLIHGSSYAVAVGQQPVGQTCSVAQGAGTIVAADVGDVLVTCASNAYRLGGTITGLGTAGLVLANGSDTLALPSLSTGFTMPATVAFGGPYAVTVQAQPVGTTCSVARAAGTMGSADVDDVAITCASNAYALGGSIDGLATHGLVLANGTDTLAVAAHSAGFALPQPVAYAAAYDVQVQAQPIGHACHVLRGSGTMPAAAVSDVEVQCSASLYSLGGSISGLDTAGLVLANGADSLGVASGAGTFTMPQAVAYGSSYAVTVSSQPRWLECGVTAGSGVMGAAAVGDVAVACQAAMYVSTITGSGTAGFADGAPASARFMRPTGVAVDAAGIVYVADLDNHRIRKVATDGSVSTLAGTGSIGAADGPGASAAFNMPRGVEVDGAGNVYVADSDNHKIRKITPDGTVSTLAGSGTPGSVDGVGAGAGFFFPYGVAVDAVGNVIVADTGAHRIRRITPDGTVTTLAGSVGGYADGTGAAARFAVPYHVAVDAAGNVFVADSNNARIRKVSPAGVVTTLAGSGVSGNADGTGTAAQFNLPLGVAADSDGSVYVVDAWNQRVRRITAAGVVTTLTGSTPGYQDGIGATARFAYPFGITLAAPGGALVIADTYNHRIRKIARTP